jgi:hypothetical protein
VIQENQIEEVVVLLAPPLPYREALREMMDADGLLPLSGGELQSSNSSQDL